MDAPEITAEVDAWTSPQALFQKRWDLKAQRSDIECLGWNMKAASLPAAQVLFTFDINDSRKQYGCATLGLIRFIAHSFFATTNAKKISHHFLRDNVCC